jgi:GNAT superfamily N-acetyltransferase
MVKRNVLSVEVKAAKPYDPVVIALCAEQQDELDVRYDGADNVPKGLEPEISFLVARADAEPVGCAGLQDLEPGVGEVRRMYIRPAHRGQGIARMLLRAVEDLARERGHVTLRLETGDLQPEALGLYQSAGYVRIPRFGAYVGCTLSHCFEKRL